MMQMVDHARGARFCHPGPIAGAVCAEVVGVDARPIYPGLPFYHEPVRNLIEESRLARGAESRSGAVVSDGPKRHRLSATG